METKSKTIGKVDKPEAASAHDVAGARQQMTAVPQGMGGSFGIQLAAGNFAMQRMFRSLQTSVPQTKLKVNQLGDVYEPEADHVAEKMMRKQSDEPQADTGDDISSVPRVVHTVLNSGGGQPLDPATRAFMEPRFGHDFSRVRVHTDERAAESARAVNSLAYTVGQDVAFNTGQYAPHSSTGQSLLAHELAHVIQQDRGGAAPSPFAANASNERAAREAALMVASGGVAIVGGASGVGITRAPRSLEVSLDPATLSFTELEGEINEIQQHLDANPVSNEENDQLMEVQGALRKELAKRHKQEGGGGKQRPKVNISQVPRSLTESLLIDETLTDAELYGEIDAIHATLETGVHKKDRANLKAALVPLEAEKQRREHARKIQRAFTPKVTSTHDEALIEVMGIVESIRPSETASGIYTLVRDGEMLTLSQEEYDKIRGAVQKIFHDGVRRVLQLGDDAQKQYDAQEKVNEDQRIVSADVKFYGGIKDPGPDIEQDLRIVEANVNTALYLIKSGQLKRGATFFSISEEYAKEAKNEAQAYVNHLMSTAGAFVTGLEITRNVAFTAEGVLAIIATGGAAAGAMTALTEGGTVAAFRVAPRIMLWAARNPALAQAVALAVAGTTLQVAEEGTLDPYQLGYQFIEILLLNEWGGSGSPSPEPAELMPAAKPVPTVVAPEPVMPASPVAPASSPVAPVSPVTPLPQTLIEPAPVEPAPTVAESPSAPAQIAAVEPAPTVAEPPSAPPQAKAPSTTESEPPKPAVATEVAKPEVPSQETTPESPTKELSSLENAEHHKKIEELTKEIDRLQAEAKQLRSEAIEAEKAGGKAGREKAKSLREDAVEKSEDAEAAIRTRRDHLDSIEINKKTLAESEAAEAAGAAQAPVAQNWLQHEFNVTQKLQAQNPTTLGTQVTIDVTGPNGQTVTIRIDNIVSTNQGRFQIVDAKFSAVTDLSNPATNLLNTVTPNQATVYGWITGGQPVTAIPRGANAAAAGFIPDVPIPLEPSVDIYVNIPGDGIAVRNY